MSQSQTQLSQSEIDEIIGKRFIEKSLTPGSLTTRLQTIASILPRIDQEDDDTIAQLKPLVSQLGKPWLLNQKKSSIKLLLACIHSDILRIYAPEQPYSDDKILTKIFQLIIQSLDGIQSPDDEGYDFHFRVLESISTVQSYIVMNDLENDHLLMQLTRTLFKITKEKTIKLALTHITDILCGLISDLQVIPEVFLEFILARLIEPLRSKNPTEYDLAATVIRRCTADLKMAIEEYCKQCIASVDELYIDAMDAQKLSEETKEELTERKKLHRRREKSAKEKRKKYKTKLSIMVELVSIDKDFLENSLMSLEECLQNEHLEIRLLFVDMFASIFTQSNPSLSRGEWSGLFRVFLKRYDDVSVEIREFMANITCLLFQTQFNFTKEIQEFCTKRIEDINERIRKEITKQVCMASIQSSSNSPNSIISVPLFNKLLQRCLDKKESVRYCAIEYCSQLFGEHLNPYWRSNKSLPSEMRALLPIPKKLISILESIDICTKLHLERVFDREMIGNIEFIGDKKRVFDVERCVAERMNVTLGIIALLPENSKRAFQKYFMREKYQLQTLINKILTTYNELRMANSNSQIEIADSDSDGDGDNDNDGDIDMKENENEKNKNIKTKDSINNMNTAALERQYEISYSNFNQRFPIYGSYRHIKSSPKGKKRQDKPSDYLKQLIESPNSKIRHYLQTLCATSTGLKSVYNCGKNLVSFVKSDSADLKKEHKTKLIAFAQVLCTRLSNVLFSGDALPVLLRKMVDIIENHNGQPVALLNSGIYILNCLCDEIPNIFNEETCLAELITLFNFPKIHSPKNELIRKLSFVSLRILAKSINANSFGDEGASQEFINDLVEKAKISTVFEEAQLATECMIKCSGKYSNIVKTLCDETSKELDITEQYLPTLLSTLSVVAKLSPNIFISRASHIIHFILDTLLPYDLAENDGIYSENNMENEEESVSEDSDTNAKKKRKTRGRKAKVKKSKAKKSKKRKANSMTPIVLSSKQCGIQILVNYLLSIVNLPRDQLGIKSIGISPIKSDTNSPKAKKKRGKKPKNIKSGLDLEIEHSDSNEETAHDRSILEDTDPFSKDSHSAAHSPISPEGECGRILDALFQVIRRYGQICATDIEAIASPTKTTRKYSRNAEGISDEKKHKKYEMTAEEVSLVNMSVDGILDIIRESRYRRLLGLLRFYELAFLIHHRNASVRKHTLQSFWNKLRDHKLPTHYSCIFPLIATDPNKKLRETYKPAITKYFERMRKENQIRSMDKQLDSYQITKLPEYLLFYLVHLLAHHPDFDEKLAKKELREMDSTTYKKDKHKPFVGWRGRRVNKSDESGYDTSPSRMVKKKSRIDKDSVKDNDEISDKGKEEMDIDENESEAKEIKVKTEKEPTPTSCVEYYGCIFNFYFDGLLRGSQSNQFPLIIKILTKIDESFDVFKPMSKGHRYLIRIAMKKLKKRYKGKSFQDFPGRVSTPKVIFKLRDYGREKTELSNKNMNISPRRVDRVNKAKKNKNKSRDAAQRLLATDVSVLATTASDSYATTAVTSAKRNKRRQKRGVFNTSEILKRKYSDLDTSEKEKKEEQRDSDHPSDNDIVNDMNVSGLDISSIRRNLNASLIEKSEKKTDDGIPIVGKGLSGADADDEVNSMIVSKDKQTKKSKNIGRKRKRTEMAKESTDKSDKSGGDVSEENNEPLKKKPKRRVKRRK